MSHTSKYSVKIKDIGLLCKTARILSHKIIEGKQIVNLWGKNNVEAIASIKIEGWRFPIAITNKGDVLYDHFGSQPGTMEKLGKLIQEYSKSLIINNIPNEVLYCYKHKTKANGDFVLTLNY